MIRSSPELARLLQEGSRSFYLSMRILPASMRGPVAVAYLCVRTTDTVADTDVLPVSTRTVALRDLRSGVSGDSFDGGWTEEFARTGTGPEFERRLLQLARSVVELVHDLPPQDRERVRSVVETIAEGQELDLLRFAPAGEGQLQALESDAHLDDYTYRVAGCVGEFWTHLCHDHALLGNATPVDRFLADGIHYGKGLQLVNILRDLPRDLADGRCYLPADRLAALGLTPTDLVHPPAPPRFAEMYGHYLDRAGQGLAAGWRYTCALPRRRVRLRLSCAWPALLGVRTLKRLEGSDVLFGPRVKVPRREVYGLILRSTFAVPFPPLFRALFPARSQATV